MTAENPRPYPGRRRVRFTTTAEQALLRAVEVACRAPQHTLHVITTIDPREGITAMPTKKVDWEYAVNNALTRKVATSAGIISVTARARWHAMRVWLSRHSRRLGLSCAMFCSIFRRFRQRIGFV